MLVYKVTFPNDKCYIGITSQSLNKRRSDHYSNVSSGKRSKFYNAIRKYGKDNINWNIIDRAETWKELCELEKNYITQFDSYKYGYNMTLGGEGTIGYKYTDAQRKKVSEILKTRVHTEESRIKRSIKMSGSNNHYYGKKFSKEHKEKLAAAKRKKIICLNNDETYNSLKEAAEDLNLSAGNISNVLRKRIKHTKGFKFKFLGEELC